MHLLVTATVSDARSADGATVPDKPDCLTSIPVFFEVGTDIKNERNFYVEKKWANAYLSDLTRVILKGSKYTGNLDNYQTTFYNTPPSIVHDGELVEVITLRQFIDRLGRSHYPGIHSAKMRKRIVDREAYRKLFLQAWRVWVSNVGSIRQAVIRLIQVQQIQPSAPLGQQELELPDVPEQEPVPPVKLPPPTSTTEGPSMADLPDVPEQPPAPKVTLPGWPVKERLEQRVMTAIQALKPVLKELEGLPVANSLKQQWAGQLVEERLGGFFENSREDRGFVLPQQVPAGYLSIAQLYSQLPAASPPYLPWMHLTVESRRKFSSTLASKVSEFIRTHALPSAYFYVQDLTLTDAEADKCYWFHPSLRVVCELELIRVLKSK